MFAAGGAVVAAGDGVAANLTVLVAGFAANTGLDMAGEMFGLAYQDAAESLLKAATAAINACRHSGALVQVGASNYSRAEAASTLGGGAGVWRPPAEPATIAAPGPPGTLGPGQPPPLLWALVESLVDDVWPDGDVAALHAAAARWRGFGAALGGAQGALSASKSLFDDQHILEAGKIDEALSQIGSQIAGIGEQCGRLAATLDNFANEVDHAQNAIRDLLHRLGSLANLAHDVVLIFEGDALEEIKKIAQDINAVLHNLGREARAVEQGAKLVMQVGDGLVVKFEKYMRRQFTHFLGEDVGNPVATAFDTWVNANEGVIKGAAGMLEGMVDLDPRWFLFDPKGAAATWSDLATSAWKGSLINASLNPQEAGEANLQQLKSLLHLDDWSTARPGLGLGENLFDGATLLLPGVGEVGAGAKGAAAGARAAEEGGEAAGAAGRAGEIGEVAAASGELGDIGAASAGLTKDLEGVARDLPKIEPPLGGSPVALPQEKLPEAPVEPVPHQVESAAPNGSHDPVVTPAEAPQSASPRAGGQHDPLPIAPHEPALTPAGGVRDPAAVPGGGAHASMSPAVPGGRPPAIQPHAAEPVTARVPASPGGSPAGPAPAAAHSPLSAPAPSAAPRFTPPGGRPAELPAPYGDGAPGHGDGGRSGAHPHKGHGGDSHGHRDGDPSGSDHGDAPGSVRQDPVHSHDAAGDGWHRLGDEPLDPQYGEPLPDHWDFADNPVDPTKIDSDVAKLIRDPEAPFGRDPQGNAYTEQQYAERFNKVGNEGQPWANFPLNDGAVPRTRVAYTDAASYLRDYGSLLDRVGKTNGKYLAVMEDGQPASWEQRALHLNSLRDPYHAYTFNQLPEEWTIDVSEVARGVGQPGGSLQVRIFDSEGRAMTIDELTDPDIGVLE